MSRRPAAITQADVARIIRAAKQAGAAEVEIQIGQQKVLVRLSSSTAPHQPTDSEEEIIL
jgi:hypothetical protein